MELLHRKKSPQKPLQRTPSGPAGHPIIVVPASVTSLLTLSNAQEFLKNSAFKPVDPHAARPDTLTFKHAVNKKEVTFQLVDVLNSKDWPRVVAVFVSGQAWQFRGWPYEEPVEVLSRIKGFYLKASPTFYIL